MTITINKPAEPTIVPLADMPLNSFGLLNQQRGGHERWYYYRISETRYITFSTDTNRLGVADLSEDNSNVALLPGTSLNLQF